MEKSICSSHTFIVVYMFWVAVIFGCDTAENDKKSRSASQSQSEQNSNLQGNQYSGDAGAEEEGTIFSRIPDPLDLKKQGTPGYAQNGFHYNKNTGTFTLTLKNALDKSLVHSNDNCFTVIESSADLMYAKGQSRTSVGDGIKVALDVRDYKVVLQSNIFQSSQSQKIFEHLQYSMSQTQDIRTIILARFVCNPILLTPATGYDYHPRHPYGDGTATRFRTEEDGAVVIEKNAMQFILRAYSQKVSCPTINSKSVCLGRGSEVYGEAKFSAILKFIKDLAQHSLDTKSRAN